MQFGVQNVNNSVRSGAFLSCVGPFGMLFYVLHWWTVKLRGAGVRM